MRAAMRGTSRKLTLLALALGALCVALAFELAGRIESVAPGVAGSLRAAGVAEAPAESADGAAPVGERGAPVARALSLLVLDPAEAPLEGAAIHASSRGADALLGATDAAGRFRGALPEGGDGSLRIELARFRSERVALPSEPVDPLVVVLHPLRAIEGRVLRTNGDSPGADLLVLAWPKSADPPTPAELVPALAANEYRADRFVATRTRGDGSFALRDLAWSGAIELEAGGTGLFTPERLATSEEGDARIDLHVRRGFAAVIELHDPSGAPVVRPGGSPWPARVSAPQAGLRVMGWLPPAVVAAGLDPALAEERADRVHAIVEGDPHEDVVEGVAFAMEAPGYAPVATRFDAQALERVTPLVRVPIRRVAAGFGELRLAFVNVPSELAAFPPARSGAGEILLDALDGEAPLSMRFAVAPDERWRATLRDLPFGSYWIRYRYSAHLEARDAIRLVGSGGFVDPAPDAAPELVSIGPVPAEHLVDLARLNVLRVELEDAGGAAWKDAWSVVFDETAPKPAGSSAWTNGGGAILFASFRGSPAFFAGLRPDQPHRLRVTAPSGARSLSSGESSERVVLAAGEARTLRFRVGE